MSWAMHHTESERYASLAEEAARQRDFARAGELYRLAAAEEVLALSDLDKSKVRTLGVTAVSAASLWFKAHELLQAQKVAHYWLSTDFLPEFAVEQLNNLLQTIWSEQARERAGIKFTQGEVLVSVSGGDVVFGGAPLDLIQRKVEEVGGLFYRTVEMLLNQPLRKSGPPSQEIQQQCRPWLFQAAPGSYQFAVRVQQPDQQSLWPDAIPRVEQVTQKFLDIVRASAQDPQGELVQVVPDEGYRDTFLKLTRNLAPTGKTFGQLEIKPASSSESRPVILLPSARQAINIALKKPEPVSREDVKDKESQLQGVLRALDLDKDLIEITLSDNQERVSIFGAGEVIDDVVGPMVNRKVLVEVYVKPNGKYIFRDIETDE